MGGLLLLNKNITTMSLSYRWLVFFMISGSLSAQTQVSILPLPARSEGFLMEDLWRISMVNAGTGVQVGTLTFSIKDAGHHVVFSADVENLRLQNGINNFNGNDLTVVNLQYGNNNASMSLRRTGALPYGEYIICYIYQDVARSRIIGEYCEERSVQPLLPPELIQPYDGEQIATTRPLLVWKAPFPTGNVDIRYALRLTELTKESQAIRDIARNKPLLSRTFKETMLVYPADAPDLQPGKSYVWQITAFAGDYTVGTTDVWTFIVAKPESPPEEPESYRLASDSPDGTPYLARRGVLRFAFNNRDSEAQLNYQIQTMDKQELKGITTEVVKLQSGINKVDLNLVANKRLKSGQKYLLVIHRPNLNDQYLEFVYQEND
jgi:hypothetical protein